MEDLTVYVSNDMTKEELQELQEFQESGKPGIGRVVQSDVFQWFRLYMSGKTYTEISTLTGRDKKYILFISHQQKWLEKKIHHYDDLLGKMTQKVTEAKLEATSTISIMVNALNKYYAKKFNKYLKDNDDSVIEELDTKLLSQYYKCMEALEKMMITPNSGDGKSNSPINLNLNLGAGAEVNQTDDNTLEITDKTAAMLLQSLAEAKKQSRE